MSSRLPTVLLSLLLVGAAALGDEPAKPAVAPAVTPKGTAMSSPNAGLSPAEAAEIGLISVEEADRAGDKRVSQVRKHLADLLTKYDGNRDGTLDSGELAKMEGVTAAPPASAPPPKARTKRNDPLRKYDMDRNFQLDEIEAAAAHDAGKAEALAKNAHVMKRFDLNRDGLIDAAELAAARAARAKDREQRGKAGAKPRARPSPPAPPAL